MNDPRDIPVPLDASTGPSFVAGVVEALYAARTRAWGLGDGKTFHNELPGSDAEAVHAKGQEYACVRMIDEGNRAMERVGDQAPPTKPRPAHSTN